MIARVVLLAVVAAAMVPSLDASKWADGALTTLFERYSHRTKAIFIGDSVTNMRVLSSKAQREVGHAMVCVGMENNTENWESWLQFFPWTSKGLPQLVVMYVDDHRKTSPEDQRVIIYPSRDFSHKPVSSWLLQHVPKSKYEDELDLPFKKREIKDTASFAKICDFLEPSTVKSKGSTIKGRLQDMLCAVVVIQRKSKQQLKLAQSLTNSLLSQETVWAPFRFGWSQGRAVGSAMNQAFKNFDAETWNELEYPHFLVLAPSLDAWFVYPVDKPIEIAPIREWLLDFDAPIAKLRAQVSQSDHKRGKSWKDDDKKDGAASDADDEL